MLKKIVILATWITLGASLLTISAFLVMQWHWRSQVVEIESQENEITFQLANVKAEPGASSKTNFAENLEGQQMSAEAFISRCQAAAKRFSVSVSSATVSPRAPTTQTLGRTEVALTARGAYAPLKQLLSESLARHPSAVLQHLSLHRNGAPTELEMQVTFNLLLLPLPSVGKGSETER